MTDRIDDGRLAAEIRERQRVVEQGRALIDKAAFAQCLADTSGALCNTARFSVACASRFTGTIGDGGACYTNIECTSLGATCVSSCTDSCCPGTCQPKYELGQTCDLGDSCEPGRVCHHTCLSGDIGSTCASDRDCDSNAWCSAGTCRPDLPLGAECTRSLQCGGETSCIGLSINSSTPGHCLAISSPGDRCDYFCYGNLYCDASGTCRELPLPGQSCSGFVPCRGTDTVCHNGQCVLLGDIGADCSSLPCMPGLFCTSELGDSKPTCVAPQQKGEPCAAPGHCESYRCSGTTDQPGLCLSWPDTCSLNVP